MTCTFQATIGGKFASVIDLRYEDIGISVAMSWTSKPRSRPRQDQGHSCYFLEKKCHSSSTFIHGSIWKFEVWQ